MTVPAIAGAVTLARNGSADAPFVVLGPSLGTTTALWAAVAERLAADHSVLRYDLPGHGDSPAPTSSFEVGEIADAVVDLADAHGAGSFYYAGDSLGSAVGLEIAARHSDRLTGIAVFCGAVAFGSPSAWHERARLVREGGTAAVREISAARWFSPGYLDRDPAGAEAALDQLHDVDGESYAMCCDALAIFDFGPRTAEVVAPLVCVAGEFDVASPPERVRALADAVETATYVLLPGAGHVPVYEQPIDVERILRSAIHPTTAQRKAS